MPYKDRVQQLSAQKKHYQDNKATFQKRQRERRNGMRIFIQSSKKGKACVDCNVEYPYYIMEYDHVRGQKISGVSKVNVLYSIENIKKEIAKCDLVCANCHRQRTWNRLRPHS